MREFGKIILYLALTVLLGAVVTPLLYWGGHWLAGRGVLPWLAEVELRRFFNRGVLVAAVLLLWPMIRWLRVPKGLAGLGLRPNAHWKRDVAVGFLASFLLMAALAGVLLWLEIYRVRSEIRWSLLAQAMVPALSVSFLEEWLFRGMIFGLLLRGLRPYWGLLFVSGLFSIVHFLKPETQLPEGYVVGWLSGFDMLGSVFGNFREPWLVLGGFLTLFAAGWLLGWTRLKTASLWMAIGLHAGWVFGLKGFSPIARRRVKEDLLPWLGPDLLVGVAALACVALSGVLLWFWFRYGPREVETAERH